MIKTTVLILLGLWFLSSVIVGITLSAMCRKAPVMNGDVQ